ncbi:hypothetical protein F383_05506 [Gossypium arboreum]|uniref:Uncharacterized protein n=1 Tax=Gossypium arboreum TaxID=29729 RepID=A0A0B0NVC9_GOSAR|nr:hypothetical protein F383_05506 [Gossypium arboreum]
MQFSLPGSSTSTS